MPIKEMDCWSDIHHLGHCINYHRHFGVDEPKKNQEGRRRSFHEYLFSKLKIVIGFYQVTHGLLDAFSYIKWPGSLESIAKYSEFLQLNVLQIAPVQCLSPELRLDAFGSLFAIMAVNAGVICLSGIAYGIYKLMILRNQNLEEGVKLKRVSQSKELVYRNLFFFLYVTYLSTCSKTADVLPLSCRKLCRDDKEELCSKYLKADYSVSCQGQKYNHYVIVAYISTCLHVSPSFCRIHRHPETTKSITDQRRCREITDSGLQSRNDLCIGFPFCKLQNPFVVLGTGWNGSQSDPDMLSKFCGTRE